MSRRNLFLIVMLLLVVVLVAHIFACERAASRLGLVAVSGGARPDGQARRPARGRAIALAAETVLDERAAREEPGAAAISLADYIVEKEPTFA